MSFNTEFSTKQECRDYAKQIRNKINIVSMSNKICENLKKQDFYKFSENILSFYPAKNEIDLRPLYQDSSKKWYLPRVEMSSKSLIIHKYNYNDILVKNNYGIPEPPESSEFIDPYKIDIAIIPALMVDKNGYRLGYGAGFYDRFISGLRKDCLKIVPVPEELFVKTLPHDSWDIPVDKVITQDDLYIVKNMQE